MGSLIGASPPVVEDVDDVPSSSVCIEIGNGAASSTSTDTTTTTVVSAADLAALEERVATLLHVHSDEFRAVETRVAQLEALQAITLI